MRFDTAILLLIQIHFITTDGYKWYLCKKQLNGLSSYKGRVTAKITALREGLVLMHWKEESKCYPTFEYMIGDTPFKQESSWGYTSSSCMFIDKKVLLHYDEENPDRFVPAQDERMLKKDASVSEIWTIVFIILFVGTWIICV